MRPSLAYLVRSKLCNISFQRDETYHIRIFICFNCHIKQILPYSQDEEKVKKNAENQREAKKKTLFCITSFSIVVILANVSHFFSISLTCVKCATFLSSYKFEYMRTSTKQFRALSHTTIQIPRHEKNNKGTNSAYKSVMES